METGIQDKKNLAKALLQEALQKSILSHPLSYGQNELWMAHQKSPEGGAYNISYEAQINFAINVKQLERVLQQLVNLHEALRTTYVMEAGNLVQKILEFQKVDFTVVEVQESSEQSILHDIILRPFNLEKSIFRACLLQRDANNFKLVLVVHHIAFDYTSIEIFIEDLKEIWQAELENRPPVLLPITEKYIDFVKYQHNLLDSSQGDRLKQYWQQKLVGADTILQLPIDKVRPINSNQNGTAYQYHISRALKNELKQFAQKEGVTLYTVFLTAYQILLYHYTQQKDFLIGISTNVRPGDTFNRVIGYFINILPQRVRLDEATIVSNLLQQTQQDTLEAFEHQNYPFSLLVKEIPCSRENSYSPLLQTYFNYVPTSVDFLGAASEVDMPKNLTFKGQASTGIMELGLSLFDYQNGDCYCFVDYNKDLFEEATIQRMIANYETILRSILHKANTQVANVEVVSTSEKHQLLVTFNDNQLPYPKGQCVHAAFEAQAQKNPNNIALVFMDKSMTYKELNDRSNQLANYLKQKGVGLGTRVGLLVDRSLDLIIGILSILKAGGTHLPLDPAYPKNRISYLLEDSEISLVITHKEWKKDLPEGINMICLEEEWQQVDQYSKQNLITDVKGNHIACIIYTSGSTGNPKGVLIKHEAIMNLIIHENLPFISAEDKMLQMSALGFDAFLFFWGVLTNGGSVYLYPKEHLLDVNKLKAILWQHKITYIFIVPSWANELIDKDINFFNHLKTFTSGADILSPQRLNRLKQHKPELVMINLYGPAENTVLATSYEIQGQENSAFPIGKPLHNVQIYILNGALNPVPIGAVGEIYIGGANLASGYLNRPELTQERFVSNPFSNNPQEKLYKTGDLGKWLPDGNILFMGRNDNQVKIRGFRIELGEVENVLLNYKLIKSGAVVTENDAQDAKRLVAYFTISEPAAFDLNDLRHYLKEHLPVFMIPSKFVLLDEIPLSSSGKIDRQRLPQIKSTVLENKAHYLPPQTALQQQIAGIWQKVLSIEKVSLHDNFFDLGGHSLLLTQVHHQLQQQLQIELPLVALFQYTTIQKLANYLSNANTGEDTASDDPNRGIIRQQKQASLKERRNKKM